MKQDNKNPKAKEKDPAARANTIKLLLTVVAAFLAALVFRRSVGILAMTPIAIAIFAASAFIGLKPSLKLLIFGITVFTFNTTEQSDMKITLMYTALCLLFCAIFELAKKIAKADKKFGIAAMSAGVTICIAVSFVFIGNPINAMSAKDTVKAYTESKYPANENAALGEFEFSDIYYNNLTKAYSVDAVSSRYPTESGVISVNEGNISDSFERITEEKICEPYTLEITELLRKYFPNDNFSVSYDSISALPGEAVLSASEGALYGNIVFEIRLGGIQTANAMNERVKQYMQIIDGSEIDYAKIIFKSGTSEWFRRSTTVDSQRPENYGYYTIERVPAGTSNFFNRYLSELISID